MERALLNLADPLSELSIGRRVMAAYTRAGITRARLAAELKTTEEEIEIWDRCLTTPKFTHLGEAAQLVGFTLRELCFGRKQPPPGEDEVTLSLTEIESIFVEFDAAPDLICAWRRLYWALYPRNSSVTRSFVTAFLASCRSMLDADEPTEHAILQAFSTAVSAYALSGVIALGGKPLTREELWKLKLVTELEPISYKALKLMRVRDARLVPP